jgi:hypothetical protein
MLLRAIARAGPGQCTYPSLASDAPFAEPSNPGPVLDTHMSDVPVALWTRALARRYREWPLPRWSQQAFPTRR